MSITIQGSVVCEQGVSFAIVLVKPEAMDTENDAANTRAAARRCFPGLPIVLASQDSRGLFRYQGRTDLVDFLASIDASRIPWKEYTFG